MSVFWRTMRVGYLYPAALCRITFAPIGLSIELASLAFHIIRSLLRSERETESEVLSYITNKSEYEKPAGQPVTLLESLYLPNYASDSYAVFSGEQVYSIKIDYGRIGLIWRLGGEGGQPGRQRVQREGCQNWSLSHKSGMPWPIVTKFRVYFWTKWRCIW